jgi:pseudouridine synthase
VQLRINRFLAQAGQGSRRGVEELVRAGRVRVNGCVVEDLGQRVDPQLDRVEVDGRIVQARFEEKLLLLHKPVGVVSALRAQDRRPTLLSLLGEEFERGRLFHVGRLDHDSSGLLLLSDDGDLAHALLHPRRPVWKTYRIEIAPAIDETSCERLRDGSIELDGRACAPARVRALDRTGSLLEVQLREGRNRQLRRMVEAVGARVLRLQRTAFGPVELGDLPAGHWRSATVGEVAALRVAAGITDPPHGNDPTGAAPDVDAGPTAA